VGMKKLTLLTLYLVIAFGAGLLGGYLGSGEKGKEVIVEKRVVVSNVSLEDITRAAYAKVSPSVVHITSTVLRRDFLFGIVPQQGTGSGILVSRDGYVLTNNHVIEDASRIQVKLSDGRVYEAELVGSEPSSDIAVIRILNPPENLTPAPLGDSSTLRVGDLVIAIGNPFGLDRTATVGIVSSLNRSVRSDEGYILRGLIQTDASINPGNSGGPLVNSRGEVVGINTAILTTSGGSIGIGFAIPINTAKRIMQEIIERDRKQVRHPWLGISGITVDEALAEALNLPVSSGALVVSVAPGSPAEKAGLRGGTLQVYYRGYPITIGGDIIVGVDGRRIESMEELAEVISSKEVGERIEITYIRRGERHTTYAVLAGRK